MRRLLEAYHRWSCEVAPLPDEPCLLVSNHGFGALTDINVLAAFAALDEAGVDRATTTLVHQLAWTAGLGPLLEALGCRPAGREAALEALRSGEHVLLFPGGDVDAAKPHRDRHRIRFAGRTGYARLAIDGGVPIVPVVTAGAGSSAYVIDDGQRLARLLRLDRLLRVKAAPISVSLPWGLSFGFAGLVPYLPLPVRVTTAVLEPVRRRDGEAPDELAARVEDVMQHALDRLASQRRAG